MNEVHQIGVSQLAVRLGSALGNKEQLHLAMPPKTIPHRQEICPLFPRRFIKQRQLVSLNSGRDEGRAANV